MIKLLDDFKKKEKDQQKKVQMKNSVEFEGNVMMENQDVIQVALDVATSELNPSGESSITSSLQINLNKDRTITCLGRA